MAKKSKTQRAKASAARAQRKAQRAVDNAVEVSADQATLSEDSSDKAASTLSAKAPVTTTEDKPKRKLFGRNKADAEKGADKKAVAKAAAKKPKKHNKLVQFFIDVKAEMKRVTWPTRTDVLRWTGVVIVALIFFGVFTAVLDNVIVTPILFWISGFAVG